MDKWFSRVGGTLGLWLGCSAFTVIELIAFFFDLLKFAFDRLKFK
jgi:hypothetical protein